MEGGKSRKAFFSRDEVRRREGGGGRRKKRGDVGGMKSPFPFFVSSKGVGWMEGEKIKERRRKGKENQLSR